MGNGDTPCIPPPTGDNFTFKDGKGRTWDLRMDMAAAYRIDKSDFSEITALEFSILDGPSRDLYMQILSQPSLLFAIIWAIVQPQVAKNLGFDPEDDPDSADKAQIEFLKGIDGSAIKAGREALWRALSDFFPDHKTVLLTFLNQYEKMQARIGLEIAGMENEIEEAMTRELDLSIGELRRELGNLREKRGSSSTESSGSSDLKERLGKG